MKANGGWGLREEEEEGGSVSNWQVIWQCSVVIVFHTEGGTGLLVVMNTIVEGCHNRIRNITVLEVLQWSVVRWQQSYLSVFLLVLWGNSRAADSHVYSVVVTSIRKVKCSHFSSGVTQERHQWITSGMQHTSTTWQAREKKKRKKKKRRGLKRLKSCSIISARLQGSAERDVFAVKLLVIFEGIQEGEEKRAGLKGTCWQ